MRIGIAIEPSELESAAERYGVTDAELLEMYESQGRNIDLIVARDQRQRESVEAVLSKNLDAEIIDLSEFTTSGEYFDFLLAVGSDPFFVRCAHQFSESFLVGIDNDPRGNQSSLLYYDMKRIERSLHDVVHDCFGFEEWTRVSVLHNGRELEPGIRAASLAGADRIKYCIRSGVFTEEQESGGFLTVSGAGSGKGATYRSAGLYLPHLKSGRYKNPTQEFARTERVLRTLTREPWLGEDCASIGLNLRIEDRNALSLTYYSSYPAMLSIDSMFWHEIHEGDTLIFKVAETPLRVVVLQE